MLTDPAKKEFTFSPIIRSLYRQLHAEVQCFNNASRDSVATFLIVREWLLFQALPSMPEEFGSAIVPIHKERTHSLVTSPRGLLFISHGFDRITGLSLASRKMGKAGRSFAF